MISWRDERNLGAVVREQAKIGELVLPSFVVELRGRTKFKDVGQSELITCQGTQSVSWSII